MSNLAPAHITRIEITLDQFLADPARHIRDCDAYGLPVLVRDLPTGPARATIHPHQQPPGMYQKRDELRATNAALSALLAELLPFCSICQGTGTRQGTERCPVEHLPCIA